MIFQRKEGSIFTPEAVFQAGMHPKLSFKVCGVAPEPQHPWDDEQGKYDFTKVSGYGFWVCQDVKDLNGTSYRQNPVLVILPTDEEQLTFGDSVTFDELGGFYSRKKRTYKFQAKSVKKVK